MTQTASPPRRNPIGLASLVAGILLLLVGFVVQSTTPAIPLLVERYGLSYQLLPLLYAIPQAVIAVIATALGVVGLVLRDRPRAAAIIGTTLGASHLVVGLVGMVGSFLVGAALG
ncbi:hypothetical protein ACT3SP_02630 [Brachybacterium sp. AOP43-C2-M15]|uniref:hypothetical protein n=1 Tax=Brachybacterium sp. AOP43-C2-M15 TaxID=3457661 RepID=UPI004033D939